MEKRNVPQYLSEIISKYFSDRTAIARELKIVLSVA